MIEFLFKKISCQKFRYCLLGDENDKYLKEKNYSFIPIGEDSTINCLFQLCSNK